MWTSSWCAFSAAYSKYKEWVHGEYNFLLLFVEGESWSQRSNFERHVIKYYHKICLIFMPKQLLGAQDNTILTSKYVSAFKDTTYAYYYAILSSLQVSGCKEDECMWQDQGFPLLSVLPEPGYQKWYRTTQSLEG